MKNLLLCVNHETRCYSFELLPLKKKKSSKKKKKNSLNNLISFLLEGEGKVHIIGWKSYKTEIFFKQRKKKRRIYPLCYKNKEGRGENIDSNSNRILFLYSVSLCSDKDRTRCCTCWDSWDMACA